MNVSQLQTSRVSGDSDYISRLWRAQRDLITQDTALTKKAKEDLYLPLLYKYKNMPSGDSVNISTAFQSRVRPAFSRGKSVIIATDPEKHILLEKERIALQEQRHRPKTPIQLRPIDVKPLGHPEEPKPPPKCKETARGTNNSALADLWKKATTIASRSLPTLNTKKLPDMSLHSQLQRSSQYIQNVIQASVKQEALPHLWEATRESAPTDTERKTTTRQQRKPYQAYGNYPIRAKTNSRDITFVLEATRCSGTYTDNALDAVRKAQTERLCCDGDEGCAECGKDNGRFTTLPRITDSQTSRPSPESIQSSGRRTLVIQLPDINCTPATPAGKRRTRRTEINLNKTVKQQELRQRELTNLIADIRELNQLNEQLTRTGEH